MSTSQSTRRFSGEYIRQQPEFQFVKAGHFSQYSRVSIDLASYTDSHKHITHHIHRPASVDCTGTGNKSSQKSYSEQFRPSTAAVIKIVQHVNKKYASISPLPRPKTSIGFASTVSEGNKTNRTRLSSQSEKISRKSSASSHGRYDQYAERKTSFYDPDLEKSKTFLHKKNDMFSKTNQYLSGARPGVRNLQLHYTGINTEYNDRVIFADLLRSAHKKNAVVGDEVYSLERRLYTKRADPVKATTFWDREGILRPPSRPKTARTVAQKKKERKAKIKEKNDKIKLGYIPRAKSLKIPSTDDMEELRVNCRYLRIDPKYQEHLYNTGLVFYSQDQREEPQPQPEPETEEAGYQSDQEKEVDNL